jgi:hypothetical protein
VKGVLKIQVVICVLFTLLYALATREGNRNGQDSALYKGAAANIYYHQQLRDADNDPLTYHAPLYPLLLSVGIPFLLVYIWLLHLGSGLGILCLWTAIARHYLRRGAVQWLFGLLLALSVPLLMIAVLVWSEMVFLLLLSGHFYLLNRFLLERREKWLYAAAAAGFLMLLQRNAGIFLFAGTGIGLFLLYFQKSEGLRLKSLFWFAFISLAGFTAWNGYQILISDHGHVVRELLPAFTPLRNFMLVFGELGANFLPGVVPVSLRAAVAAGLLGLSGYGVREDHRKSPLFTLLLSAMAVYLLTWLVIPAYENNISRFMAAVLPLFYLLLFYALQMSWPRLPRVARYLITGLTAVVLLYNAVRILHNALNWGNLL